MKKLLSILLAAAMILCLPAGALAEGETALVTDAYTYQAGTDGFGGEYHIPQVNLPGPGAAALNAAIWDELYNGYMYDVLNAAETMGWSGIAGIRYDWAVSGDVLSICADIAYDANDLHDYAVYNVSLSDGERISDRELFAAAGVTREQFNDLLRAAVGAAYDGFAGMPELGDFLAEQRDRSLSDDSIARARPYLNADGALCAVGLFYPLAGAERYYQPFTLTSGGQAGGAF